MRKLIEEIRKVQRLRRLSDRKMALEMGISHSLLSRIKRGQTPMTGKFLIRLSRTYPELSLAVYDYMNGQDEPQALTAVV